MDMRISKLQAFSLGFEGVFGKILKDFLVMRIYALYTLFGFISFKIIELYGIKKTKLIKLCHAWSYFYE